VDKIVIGIDPGAKGGIAFILPSPHTRDHSIAMPMAGKDVDAGRLAALLRGATTGSTLAIAYLEKVHAMPKQGVSSSFKFGESYGVVKGVLGAISLPYQLVTPQKWKKVVLEGTDKSKEAAIDFCRRMYPEVNLLATERSRKPHSGIADALCIAHYGVLQERQTLI
jgi:crossover junction endodeoxyribonuclease RuvC